MFSVLNVVYTGIALLLCMALGFLCCKFGWVPPKEIPVINRYNLLVCFFPMMMRSLAKKKLNEINFLPALISIFGSLLCYVVCSLLFLLPVKDKLKFYISTMLPTCYINYLIVGIPVFDSIWNPDEDFIIPILSLGNDPISVPIFLILSNIYNIQKNNKLHRELNDGKEEKLSCHLILMIFKRVITNPIILGLICGLIWSATGWNLPYFIDNTLLQLNNVVLGLALFSVGGFLSQHSLLACNWLHFILCIFIRHFLFPICIGLFCFIFHLSPRMSRQCFIMAGMPSATASYILSETANIGPGVASTMIFWTTILCVPFTIMWIYILDALKIFVE